MKLNFLITKTFLGALLLLFCPVDLDAQTPDIFTSSFMNDAVVRFDGETGAFLGNFVSPGSGGLGRPQQVYFHPNTGDLIVVGILNSQLKKYDGETGAYLGNFTSGYTLNKAYLTESNGVVCEFSRTVTVSSGDENLMHDLSSQLYVLYSHGSYSSGVIQYHGPSDAEAFITNSKVDILASLEKVSML